MTLIKNATTQLTGALAAGDEMVGLGTQSGSDSISMTLDELKLFIGTALDKIVDTDTQVEVMHTGIVRVTVGGTDIFDFTANALKPAAGTFDLGTSSNGINDIYIAGAIQLATNAIGDMYVRNASGNLDRIVAGTSAYVLTSNGPGTVPTWQAASGGAGDARWQTWASTSRLGDNSLSSVNTLEPGTPVRYKATADTTWNYAIITDRSTTTHTIAGYLCGLGVNDDDFEYGSAELVVNETIVVNGAFADANIVVGTSAGLLYADLLMKLHYVWNKSDAFLVQHSSVCFEADTTSKPQISAAISDDNITYSKVFDETDVFTTLNSSSVKLVSGKYEIGFGDNLDINIVAGGSGDAMDISIFLTFILK